jgi:hypothetical protein
MYINKFKLFLFKKIIKLPNKEENMLEITLNWTLANIKKLFNDKKTPSSIRGKVTPDITTYGITLMSHSSSGHTVTSYLNKTCGQVKSIKFTCKSIVYLLTNNNLLFLGFIMLDPVDGYDPFGFLKLFITNPPKQLPFYVPTLIVSTGLDAVPTSN